MLEDRQIPSVEFKNVQNLQMMDKRTESCFEGKERALLT